ncbi:hypothetical protein LINPERPRIM_LOCUS30070 [Linum perenne]
MKPKMLRDESRLSY